MVEEDGEVWEDSRIKEGDMVLFAKYSGLDFTVDEEAGYRILELKEILCILEPKDPIVPITD